MILQMDRMSDASECGVAEVLRRVVWFWEGLSICSLSVLAGPFLGGTDNGLAFWREVAHKQPTQTPCRRSFFSTQA